MNLVTVKVDYEGAYFSAIELKDKDNPSGFTIVVPLYEESDKKEKRRAKKILAQIQKLIKSNEIKI
jgi:hypothetical protein